MATKADDPIGMANGKYIFIDTNLNTTAIVHACLTDTTLHIKEKLLAEHLRVNPSVGEIEIRALKVKRRGQFYTMPDSLPVTEMFLKSSQAWYLTADCARIISTSHSMQLYYDQSPPTQGGLQTEEHGGLLSEPNIISARANKRKNKEVTVSKDIGLLEWYAIDQGDETLVPVTDKKIGGDSHNVLVASHELTDDNTVLDIGIPIEKSEAFAAKDSNLFPSDTEQELKPERKKRKISNKNDEDKSHLEQAVRQGESSEPFVEAVYTVEKEGEGCLLLTRDDKAMLFSESKTPDCTENELEKNLIIGLPDLSEANVVLEHNIGDGEGRKKKKKKKDKKSACINLEKSALEKANNSANISPALQNFNITEEVQIQQSDDGTMKKNIGNEDQIFDTSDADVAGLANENEIVESNQAEKYSEEVKILIKKTRNSRASESDAQDNLTFKDQSVSAEVLPITAANGKLTSGNEGEIDLVISQTEKKMEDDGTKKKNMGNYANDTAFLVLEKENEILEYNQADRNKKVEGDTGKKSKKKRKKSRVTESEFQENFPTEGANITSSEGNVKLTSGNEDEINIVISQTDQTLGADVHNKENNGNDADIPLLENGNAVLECNQANKIKKDEGDTGKKSKKKRKKSRITESEFPENFPTEGANITSSEGNVKFTSGNESEINIVISQSEQMLEDDVHNKENNGNDADIPLLEDGNAVLECNQANIKKDEVDTSKKSKKKRKKSRVTESEFQENFPTEGANITSSEGNVKLTSGNGGEINIVISQTDQTLGANVHNKENNGNDAEIPLLENGNTVLECNQANKIKKDEGDTGKISKKKRKKSRVTESEFPENFPTEGANITSSEGNVKFTSGNESEINIVISQTEQMLEDDVHNKENNGNDADIPLLEDGNAVLECDQANKIKKDEVDTSKKSKKKRKKSRVTESEFQENFPTEGANITSSEGNVKLTSCNEGEINIVISQTDQTLGADVHNKENNGNDAEIPLLENGNAVLECNQANKIKKDEGDTGKISKKKRKKSRVTESEFPENFPTEGANITTSEGNVKLTSGNESEINIMISQTEQTLEDVVLNNENNGNSADIPHLDNGNTILECNQADKVKKDEGDNGEKSNKKRKKSQVAESDVQDKSPTKVSNSTPSEANVKLPSVNENEATIVISQTEQTLKYDGTGEENMGSGAVSPVLEKDEIPESIQADKFNRDESVTGRKSGKKGKKSQVSESNVQENFPIKGSNITSSGANDKLPIGNGNESKIVPTEHTLDDDGTKKTSVVSDADCLVTVKEKEILESNLTDRNNEGKSDDKKSKKRRKKSEVTVSDERKNVPIEDEPEEKLAIKDAHVVTDDHGIDFRLHFVHENTLPKAASDDNVVVTSQLNDEMETARNVKNDVLPSMSALSDLPKSSRLSDKQDSEHKSSLKNNARGMRIADAKLVMKTPQEKSLLIKPRAPMQDRSKTSIASKTMLMKTPETKNVFPKSGSIFKDRSFNTYKMTLMKTPGRNNLFTKPGSIFQDNGVEDDVGDNVRTATSDDTTDDSSESDDSEGESETSDNLNGSSNGKGISDSGMLEMSKILRNSAQFKKAKLIASQTEPPKLDESDCEPEPKIERQLS